MNSILDPENMRKLYTVLIATGLLAVAVTVTFDANAREIGFGDIEVGVTACDEAIALAEQSGSVTETFVSAITDSPAVKLGQNAFGFDFVQNGVMLCGPDQKVAGIVLTIPKHRAGEIADALAGKYVQKARNLPRLGNGLARYESSSKKTTAEVTYAHVSFEAEVLIETQEFIKMYAAYNKKEKEQEASKVKSAF
ncbi:hypothetical protein GCM10011505_34070 [Tistrella bauzanensis]|uniref:Uncharacterized protein n=1 Tax=Tistrella bauzanensis TaxID=657419 RepID=A0ABQ1ITK2_9PROT|nr:hypothetical protein [Tistrella bauzanensis]GGB50171.1 hypothetical protein GCM10011505_34070 [Tistrella bauzanensis]